MSISFSGILLSLILQIWALGMEFSEPIGDTLHKSLHSIPFLEHEHKRSSTDTISHYVHIPQMHTQQTGLVTIFTFAHIQENQNAMDL